MRKLLFVSLMALFADGMLFSASPDAYLFAYADKNKVTIGDRVNVTLVLNYSKDVKFGQFAPEENLKNFEIKNYKISKPKRKYLFFGKYVKKYEYILSTFTTGVYEIKPFVIKFTANGSAEKECQTNPLKIEVVSLLDRESAAHIRDIKPPVNFRGAWLFYLVLTVVPLCLAAGFIAWRNYLKKDEFYNALPEYINPYEYAAGELEKLEKSELIKTGLFKVFYFRLSYIVRIYLSRIYSVNIMDMTTNETVRALREKVADRKFLITLREFFEFADLVKFAKYVPEEKDISGSFASARTIIEVLKPEKEQLLATEGGK